MTGLAGYGALLADVKPELIRSEEQNQAYIEKLEELTRRKKITVGEEKLVRLLILLVEEYEDRHYPVPEAPPVEIIRHLMEQHSLRQKDLIDVFGTESIVSDVLNGKRELSKEHIRRLSAKFHVSPSIFF